MSMNRPFDSDTIEHGWIVSDSRGRVCAYDDDADGHAAALDMVKRGGGIYTLSKGIV